METFESIMLRLGFDSKAVTTGTEAMLAQQKKASMEYVSFWESASAKRAVQEQTFLDASFARYQDNLAKKAAADKAWMEGQAAMYAERDAVAAIGAGSIPANMIRKEESHLARDAEGALIAGAAGGAAHGAINSGVMRETMIIIRESVRGMWNRVISSFSVLLGRLGVGASTLIGSIPVIGAGVAGILANLHMSKELDEMAGGYGTNKNVQESRDIVAKRHAEWLAEKAKKALELQRELNRLDEEHEKNLMAVNRAEVTGEWRLLATNIQRHTLMQQMSYLDKNSVEYKQKQLELDELDKDVASQQRDIAREKAEIEKSVHEKRVEILSLYKEGNSIDRAVPTIEDLAGEQFTRSLNSLYGKGGRFNIADGTGPLGQAARDAELFAKQQMWDVTHGNYKQANIDRQNQIAAENKLSAAGIETPEMKFAGLAVKVQDINANIAALLAQARSGGIVIQDSK